MNKVIELFNLQDMSKQDLANIYQAKKKYLQLSNSKDQMYNKVFATYEW